MNSGFLDAPFVACSPFPDALTEVTTVTRKRRRVARFDPEIVLEACQVNRPSAIAVHGLDYLGFENQGRRHFGELNDKAKVFLEDLRRMTGVPIKYAFTGRPNDDVVSDFESSRHCGVGLREIAA
jgi:adenylosuccinate synthase